MDDAAFTMRDAADGPPPDADAAVHAAAVRWPAGIEMRPSGLYAVPPGEEKPPLWLCGRFDVLGEARTSVGAEWSLVAQWKDGDGAQHRMVLPRRQIVTDPAALEGEMASLGLRLTSTTAGRSKLRDALMGARTSQRITLAPVAGWHGSDASGWSYLAPDGVSYGTGAAPVMLYPVPAAARQRGQRGTLAEWREKVAALMEGNDQGVLAMSASFAGMVLALFGEPSGGLHFFGRSQRGKTTLLRGAASVYGEPTNQGEMRTWRQTANALEGVAAAANDGILCLDELAQCSGKDAGEVAYLLANGAGKSRADRNGNARAVKSWRVLALSSGEIDFATKVAEVGGRQMAGQEVRMLGLPITGEGPFAQNLHGFPSPMALTTAINERVAQYHGTAAPAFLERVAALRSQQGSTLEASLKASRQRWLEAHAPIGADAQVQTAARRIGTIAVAGELATAFGILPWPAGEANRAAAACFTGWLAHRGGAGSHEDADALGAVRRFMVMHGQSRFAMIQRSDTGGWNESDEGRNLPNRVGWRCRQGENWLYLFDPAVFRHEVCAGRDVKVVTAALIGGGFLRPESEKQRTRKFSLAGYPSLRVYEVSGELIGGEGRGE